MSRDGPPVLHRLGETATLLLGGMLVTIAATVSLSARDQLIFASAVMAMYLLMRRAQGRVVTLVMMMFSMTMTLRYVFWRATETLEFGSTLELALGLALLAAEFYAAMVLILGYVQTIAPYRRRPLPLPADDATWPTVDVFIPTYNESLDVVRSTVLAAMSMDWPPGKMKVFILDDGRRAEFRDFAASCGCGYITRDNNRHAKAGNLNNAMRQTDGEYIVIFDCDHIATRGFLQLTMGWMVAEPRLAMVQTPHHFYSPDPFQRNLASGTRVPSEGNLFYGLIQDGNDYWNACFFCGSCAVLRRTALEEIGGIATETVTEDAHTMLKLHRRGWESAYLRLPLAAGLATERLGLHIGQRIRWARGMLQIFRLDNPLLGRGLTLGQRLCYLQACSHFLFALPRVIFLVAPLAYLLGGQNVIAASPLAITAYSLPHILLSTMTNSRIQQHWRHSFWSEIYESVLALALVRVTLVTLLAPRRGRFNVTAKGGLLENGYFDLRAVYPNLILAGLLIAGVGLGITRLALFENDTLTFQALLLNSIWGFFSLLIVLAALAVGRETRQLRNSARIAAELPVRVRLPDGTEHAGVTIDISSSGARMHLPGLPATAPEGEVAVTFWPGEEDITVAGRLVGAGGQQLQVTWQVDTLEEEARVVRIVYGRVDAWVGWGDYPPDRPLRSLLNVLVSIRGLFRPPGSLLQGEGRARADKGSRRRLGAAGGGAAALLLLLLALPAAAQPFAPTGTPPGGTLAPLGAPAAGTPDSLAAARPAFADAQGPGSRVVVLNLRQLGAAGTMTLRGTSDLQGLEFGIRADEVVTAAQLTLTGAMSPSMIPEFSNITVTLNELYVGTIPVDRDHPTYQVSFPVSPTFFLSDSNHLNFRFTGRYTRECNDPLSGLLWGSLYDSSTLTLRLERLPAQRGLGRLPLPFFDPRERERLTLPFVLPSAPRDETLKAAGVLASWFGQHAAYRGASFPLMTRPPGEGNAVVILVGEDVAASGLGLPALSGPTLAVVANPTDSLGSLLVVAGRTPREAEAAATALAIGARAFGNVPLATVRAPELPQRRPYDAPNWIPADRPVRLGELVEPSALINRGYVGMLHVAFRTAPDFYTWRDRPFPLDLRITAPPGPVIDLGPSRLDVSMNGLYIQTRSLAPEGVGLDPLRRLVGLQPRRLDTTVPLPTYTVFAQNDLQLFFDARPLHRGDCVAVPADLRMAVDPDSTVDLSRGWRVSTLPNLAWFASAGFPFTRMADLSDTAVVLPEQPGGVEISAFLMLMGRIGAFVGHPATGLVVTRPGDLSAVAGRDLLLLGTLQHLGSAGGLLDRAPVRPTEGGITVAVADELNPVLRLFGDAGARDRDRAAAAIAAGLSDDWAALVGMESPLQRGRSLVALLAATPQAIETMILGFDDPAQNQRIQGDLTLFKGGEPSSFRIGDTYTFGHLPFWLWPSWALSDRPVLLATIMLGGCSLFGLGMLSLVRHGGRRGRKPPPASRANP
ncbi:Cellulose synthase catalytic subunit [UDP-forming] / Cyclic di-GMP-binding domain [Rhodovastum atsumiense]|uniref:Cellulose synthase catalytic subunit [UDP-forming] n=1 Tax=Rhodovastum atsumiense TaxID=504468 RepID=A0A5M6IMW8_9PROT|nr:UDP-forming cellulose synthase catalytic subunit [Rhodovastum atsumiense]KAA5609317.1 UDP-forming cellulose synthase catalytic subunit [Rhodovastum atsumiense]CAH2602386.1 Cellulose synthase catalytic subunit [UDP-forming] / Cyclic di-GMP-binding domain [Rhodovastum atsumiense]